MLKESSSYDGVKASSNSRSGVSANNSSGGSLSPRYNCNPFLSSSSPSQFDDSTDFSTNYYSSLFAHNYCKSPSDTSFDDAEAMAATERRLFHAGFVLEYQQLYNRYTMCLAHLQESLKEVNALGQENESLRLANADLVQRLSLLSQATIQNCLLSDFSNLGVRASPPNVRPPPGVVEQHRLERRNQEQVPIPKSISVRSSGYLKLKAQDGSAAGQSSHRVTTQPLRRSQRVCVPGVKTEEEEALEFDVYNQGMQKTEICNKWQETGACPYGDNCQFAHGIKELRPVIRHPRYKTEICRMVLAGDNCPYGHRCHFRHSITDQDRPSSTHLR